jgi:hypothetical protein
MNEQTQNEAHAPREEIFAHLRALLNEDAVTVSKEAAGLYSAGEHGYAINFLKKYDATIGGIGIYRSGGMKLPGIYRPLSSIEAPILHGHADERSRSIVHSSCAYLEALIKKLVFLWPWEKNRATGVLLGSLIERIKKRLPLELEAELRWLDQRVYVFAETLIDLGHEPGSSGQPAASFELDESVAVYFIVRALGRKLEELSGRPLEAFLEGGQLSDLPEK